MSFNALYTDLSGYYDLMCADIDYGQQSEFVYRIHQLFGNQGKDYLDLACGTGPHVRHFIDFDYNASGLDINQPMLDLAALRCPEAIFSQQDMGSFKVGDPVDLVTCFLYSIHYNNNIAKLKDCIASVHSALNTGGVFCFNAVDKSKIDNSDGIKRTLEQDDSLLTFQSGWRYCGEGERQTLHVKIEKQTGEQHELWQDEHPMVAITFQELKALLEPYFEVHIFEHSYGTILPWNEFSGNAIFVAIKNT
jgi:SAM-dependent methyltransferase